MSTLTEQQNADLTETFETSNQKETLDHSNPENNKNMSSMHEQNKDEVLDEQKLISKFTRHVIKQRSGNFPEVKRRTTDGSIYQTVCSNETTNRGRKLLQGSEWVSRGKLNTSLYENRVFYNGVEHKLMSRKRQRLNPTLTKTNEQNDNENDKDKDNDDDDEMSDDDFDLNKIVNVEDALKPISCLGDVVTHPAVKKTFLNGKVLNNLEQQTTLMIEKAQMSSSAYSNLLNVFLGDDPLPYLCDKMGLPDYDHNLHIDENHEYIDISKEQLDSVHINEDKFEVADESISESKKVIKKQETRKFQEEDVEKEDANKDTIEVIDVVNDNAENDDATKNSKITKIEENVSTVSQDPQTLDAANNSGDDMEDPFFALPRYKTNTLLERMNELQKQGLYVDDIENARQLTQIALQRNQEFIKNLTRLRMNMLKAERIRTRLVKWGREYAGIPEEGVSVPNILTAVKRGLISASTNNISQGETLDQEDQDEKETEEENS
ncbi:hypothetical protein ACO0QE_003305 [Hanseniaspora vineae]